jgi:hypothetical protein
VILGHYEIRRSHGVVACAATQTQHQSVGDYLRADGPFEGKNDHFDPVPSSRDRYEVKVNVKGVAVRIIYILILR